MKQISRPVALLAVSVFLSGCVNSATRLSKPVEAYGKALTRIDGAIGDDASTYRRGTRLALLELIQASPPATGGDIQISDEVMERIVKAANDPHPTDDLKLQIVTNGFICNPLKASFLSARASKELAAVGQSLKSTASSSPATLVGLAAALSEGYEIQWPKADNKDGALSSEILKQCEAVTAEAFLDDLTPDPDWVEYDRINSKAWSEGAAAGSAPAAGVGAVFEVIGLLREVLLQGGVILDQHARSEAIAKFFRDEGNVTQFQTAIKAIDQAARASQLAARINAKDKFRVSWSKYVLARQGAPGASRLGGDLELYKASNDLISASLELDIAIRGRAIDKVAGPAWCDPASGVGSCYYTALGSSLAVALASLEAAAKKDWSKMTAEDQRALIEDSFSILSAAVSLSNDLAGFENDKTNFRKLSNVVDDLPW